MSKELLRPVYWEGDLKTGYVWMMDQRLLPHEEIGLKLHTHGDVAEGIRGMAVRGAPAIGVSAAMGFVLGAREAASLPDDQRDVYMSSVVEHLATTRPTAINLFWALKRMQAVYEQQRGNPFEAVLRVLHNEALAIQEEDTQFCLDMGEHGASLFAPNTRVLTHCNAGALATSAFGTALGVIRAAHAKGLVSMVYADETRPYLQGARLTSWELHRDGIPVTLITDSMAGHFMRLGEIDCVVVGSDRIAANGDVANKIGTYSVAVLCKEHNIPFYVAAPTSTIDLDTASGDLIPIEERSAEEVTKIGDYTIAPEGISVRHPAFDVTPARLVTAIITERGIASPPSVETIGEFFKG